MWAREAIKLTVDGKEEFGTKTPNGKTHIEYPVQGLPEVVVSGGFIDYGSGSPQPIPARPCKYRIGPKDGVPDTGDYYVQGGEINYSGFSVGIGVRYQF